MHSSRYNVHCKTEEVNPENYFSYFSTKIYVVHTHQGCGASNEYPHQIVFVERLDKKEYS